MNLENISSVKSFNGWQKQFKHTSQSLGCDMVFSIYLPEQSEQKDVPVLYWLSGLTCTDENFTQKSGMQSIASHFGIAIVAPDTSPRGDGVANDDGYDLGQGAGFYINATQEPWKKNYQMYDYIVKELPALIENNFPVSNKKSIAGHSMGGHGALTIALKNPEMFQSVSAFSPICNPVNCPWGQKAFSAYLGADKKDWQEHDASVLMTSATQHTPALVHQGLADTFLTEQLHTHALETAGQKSGYPLTVFKEDGYDHSYYFIASFFKQHVEFHCKYLMA